MTNKKPLAPIIPVGFAQMFAISGAVMYALLSCNENRIVRVLSLCLIAFLFMSQYIQTIVSVVAPSCIAYAGHLGGMISALLLYCLIEKK